MNSFNPCSAAKEAKQMTETRGQKLRTNLKRLAALLAAEMSALEESVSNLLAELEALSSLEPPAPQY